MVLRTKPAKKCGNGGVVVWCGFLLACLHVCWFSAGAASWSQSPVAGGAPVSQSPPGSASSSVSTPLQDPAPETLAQWEGKPVRSISFQGVAATRLEPLPGRLPQLAGTPLNLEKLRESLRRLFATGVYDTIQAEGSLDPSGVDLIFRGTPRTFIGTVGVEGAKGATVNTQLLRAGQLTPGTRFTQTRLAQAILQMRRTLSQNGFHEPVITQPLTPLPEEQLVNIAFHIVSGPQARVGKVDISGDSGMSADEFRRHAHLKTGAHVDHDTGNRALAGVLKHYQGQERLEAEIKLESEHYDAAGKRANFRFSSNRGPVVKVLVEGASIGPERVKRIIPVFEEGTVDEDLLNEGSRRLRDYYQRLGYFDVKVNHEQQSEDSEQVVIVFKVQQGPRRRVERVSVQGNHYFDAATLKELLNVHAADTLDRHGAYSQALVSADVSALQALYRNNGFPNTKITPETSTPETSVVDNRAPGIDTAPAKAGQRQGAASRTAPLDVIYRIEEGEQQRVGTVQIEGNEHVDPARLTLLLNTRPGQLLSPQNLAGDRDTILTDYMSRGFDQVTINVVQQIETTDANKVDVVFHIAEGPQLFVRKMLVTGLHYTRPDTVARAITLHSGDPLNQTALLDTQRNLYELALFNEVDAAVENPTGGETYKTILLQAAEARRWTLTYGFGFEAQTGTPQNNCKGAIASGIACNPNGKTGVSPRILADVTRNSLFGRDQSASLQATYGLLEQKINLLLQIPHFEGNRNFGFTFSGGYANSQDVTTYVASRLEGGVRFTESFNTPGSFFSKANTLIYQYNFRRVKVAEGSLQVGPFALTQLSTAARVAGPAFTWIRDTRDSALDAHRGTYTSFQQFLSDRPFGAQAEFNRLDVSNSSFYGFGKDRFVLARNTRYGQMRAFGSGGSDLIPLPERLYAGGPTSLRGFSFNAAGPRDPETGYPIGGAGALINSTELRLPPPTLPWLGNTVSFVLFHDMGNIFANASDAWLSALRVRQPNRGTCKVPYVPGAGGNPSDPKIAPPGPVTSTGPQGECSFNYFSHTPGIGLRYHTPVGPIRLDFSYNLNPPIYPVTYNYSLVNPLSPHVGEATHFNFFFSLGQSF